MATSETVETLKSIADMKIQTKDDKPPTLTEKETMNEIKANALALLAKCAFLQGEKEAVQALKDQLKTNFGNLLNVPEISSILAEINLGTNAKIAEGLELLEQKLSSNPKDKEALLKIANYYVGQNNHEQAINFALKLMRIDKSFQNDAPKKLLLDIFDVLGAEHELTKQGRRRMSSLLLV